MALTDTSRRPGRTEVVKRVLVGRRLASHRLEHTLLPKILALPVAAAIAILLAIVVSSYRQTVKAYPSGGGAYIVSKDNLAVDPHADRRAGVRLRGARRDAPRRQLRRSLGAADVRAVYFDLDPDVAHRMGEEWGERDPGIPLDVVEAPFRDLTGPMLDEVRRVTSRGDSVCAVILPEFVVRKWRHFPLHNQNALFVKQLLLFEPRVVLSSVPFVLEEA